MKFKDIDLQNDYFGHGCWEYNVSPIFRIEGISKPVENKMTRMITIYTADNQGIHLNRYVPVDFVQFTIEQLNSDNWFVLKKIFKTGENLNITEWELWR